MKKYFEGYYYKHQKGNRTIAFIPAVFNGKEFIQVITDQGSYTVPYIGGNTFSDRGICIDIHYKDLNLTGEIRYSSLTPIQYDAMGFFRFFPMECRHGVISMHHKLSGNIKLNGEIIDFTDGIGYIEKDSGVSFPKTYLWLQCNDFSEKCSLMISVADIPFMGFAFQGCICVVYYGGKEYRLATYLGVKILCCNKEKVMLKQGKYCLVVDIENKDGHRLFAPELGEMTRTIHETVCTNARFRFYIKNALLFDLKSNNASFEYVI